MEILKKLINIDFCDICSLSRTCSNDDCRIFLTIIKLSTRLDLDTKMLLAMGAFLNHVERSASLQKKWSKNFFLKIWTLKNYASFSYFGHKFFSSYFPPHGVYTKNVARDSSYPNMSSVLSVPLKKLYF